MSGKRAFSDTEIKRLSTFIQGKGVAGARDLAILRVGLDSLLRASDLLSLKIQDVLDSNGAIRRRIHVMQRKTGNHVEAELSDRTIQALSSYLISRQGAEPKNPLFPGRKRTGTSITPAQWRRILKGYAEAIGLKDLDEISSHSLRKTIPTLLYQRSGGNLKACQILLGHTSLSHTEKYLSVSQNQAFDLKRLVDL